MPNKFQLDFNFVCKAQRRTGTQHVGGASPPRASTCLTITYYRKGKKNEMMLLLIPDIEFNEAAMSPAPGGNKTGG